MVEEEDDFSFTCVAFWMVIGHPRGRYSGSYYSSFSDKLVEFGFVQCCSLFSWLIRGIQCSLLDNSLV